MQGGNTTQEGGQERDLDRVVRLLEGCASVDARFADVKGVHVRFEPASQDELCECVSSLDAEEKRQRTLKNIVTMSRAMQAPP